MRPTRWIVLTLSLLFAFAVHVPAAAEDNARDLIKEYEEAVKDGKRQAQERLVDRIAATNDKAAAKFLLAELDRDQKARKQKKAGLPGAVRFKIIDGLSRFTDEDSVGLIGKAALALDSNKDHTLALDQFDFFKPLARMEGVKPAEKSLREALADAKNPFIKCAALEAIRQVGAKRFLDDVCAVLAEKNELWNTWLIVPINTFACLEELVEPTETASAIKVVKALVEWVKRTNCEDERVKFYAGKMLQKVTGEVADMSAVAFWEWWIKQMEFSGKVDTKGKPEGKQSKTVALPPVFDTAPVGKRFVFVIDISKSMEMPLKITLDEIEKRKEERGPVSGKRKDEKEKKDGEGPKEKEEENPLRQLPWENIHSKIELAREELSRAIKTFEGDREFAIITYSTDVEVITGGWVKATAENCSQWSTDVKKLQPVLMTNIHGGLTRAMKISSKGIDCENPSVDSDCILTGADSIIFLTDGWASWDDQSTTRVTDKRNGTKESVGDGPFIYSEDIWPDILRQNLFRKVIINTVGIGMHDKELLRTLAVKTGGIYVDWGFPE